MIFRQIASGSSGNCYTLSHNSDHIMIECGIPVKKVREQIEFPVTDLLAALVSHQHKDHSGYIPALIKKWIDIYAPKSVFDSMGVKSYLTHPLKNKKQFEIGPFKIMPFDVLHDVENFGYLISAGQEKLLFATDTPYIKYQFKGLTQISIECNFQTDILDENVKSGLVHRDLRRRINKNHFSLERLLKFLKSTDISSVSVIHLLHLSKDNCDPIAAKKAVQAATGTPVKIRGIE